MNRLYIIMTIVLSCFIQSMSAQRNSNRFMIGAGAMYERGLETTVGFEHISKYHNAWEFFAQGYVKWDECPDCGHVCQDSFWNNYRTWLLGIAYKPCVVRGRNNNGNIRVGASFGSDTDDFLYCVNLGYEHTYNLKKGWAIYWQVKTEVIPAGHDLFRTGVHIGIKIPTN